MKPNLICYDLETRRGVPPRNGARLPGIEYVESWDDHANMGIACLVAYDFANELPLVYCEDNLSDFARLIQRADYCISFNGINFDNQVLAANGITVPQNKSLDLLQQLWQADGLPIPDGKEVLFDPARHSGFSLDAVCSWNFDLTKSGNGAFAPVLFQQGKLGAVISYCLRDVMLTWRLFRLIFNTGEIKHPKTGLPLPVKLPKLLRNSSAAI